MLRSKPLSQLGTHKLGKSKLSPVGLISKQNYLNLADGIAVVLLAGKRNLPETFLRDF